MSQIQTRSQRDMKTAAERVNTIKGKSWAKIYGGLCHSFPVLVHTIGLAQALAFHQSKAAGEGDRAQAHQQLLDDVKTVIGTGFDPASAPLTEYLRATRQVLAAWVFFKRFAVSVLKAEVNDGKES